MFTLDYLVLNFLLSISAESYFKIALGGMVITYLWSGSKQSKKKAKK